MNDRSWDHSIRPLPQPDRERDDAYLAGPEVVENTYGDSYPHHWTHCRCRGRGDRPGSCHHRVEFLVGYAYVTGRGGRVGHAERRVCRKHAEAFARKYGLAVPA